MKPNNPSSVIVTLKANSCCRCNNWFGWKLFFKNIRFSAPGSRYYFLWAIKVLRKVILSRRTGVAEKLLIKTRGKRNYWSYCFAKAVRSKKNIGVESIKRIRHLIWFCFVRDNEKKTGDANVVAAISRVTGVSTNGGFITVRGIGRQVCQNFH